MTLFEEYRKQRAQLTSIEDILIIKLLEFVHNLFPDGEADSVCVSEINDLEIGLCDCPAEWTSKQVNDLKDFSIDLGIPSIAILDRNEDWLFDV